MTTYDINAMPRTRPIPIGNQTEAGVEKVGFDVTAWLARWPGMTVEVWVTAPGASAAYQAQSHMDGTTVVWDVSASDTITAGQGSVVVMGYVDDKRKLSCVAQTDICATIVDAMADPPESQQPWYEAVMEALGEVTLPTVTAADNGKFMRVTDGKWGAVALLAAEEVGY